MTVLVAAWDADRADGGNNAELSIYVADTHDQAVRFVDAWNECEVDRASSWGGYPGEAVIVVEATARSAGQWLADRAEWIGELA